MHHYYLLYFKIRWRVLLISCNSLLIRYANLCVPPQEPIHLRNRELLVLKAQLQRRVEELQKDQDAKMSKSSSTPSQGHSPRMSSPVNV